MEHDGTRVIRWARDSRRMRNRLRIKNDNDVDEDVDEDVDDGCQCSTASVTAHMMIKETA